MSSRSITVATFFVLACFLGTSTALKGDAIDTQKFNQEIKGGEHAWAIEFYSPMCGACQVFGQEWDKIHKEFKGTLKMGHINVDKEKALVKELGVMEEGIPNVRLFLKQDYTDNVSIDVDYGDRKAKDVISDMRDSIVTHTKKDSKGFILRE